ncbi:pyrophosphate-energized vacuolar membrane proton pump-like [Hibiscus syriacus]|uniref:pyrophosphate-energized vacuolar membrane proton pump-like n=1 Tax=Hibiscus syriacus TaxID=106335 RepID=UPI00192124EF|nr:pyrophosphate-energized vacuolar membrane proton pump-like [Hibiscus syriacus]
MAGTRYHIGERTEATGSTTPAIAKGFAIGSAALLSLPLFGAFLCPFSSMTMKSVGSTTLKMVDEVRKQFNTISGLMEGHAELDYATYVKFSIDASIK